MSKQFLRIKHSYFDRISGVGPNTLPCQSFVSILHSTFFLTFSGDVDEVRYPKQSCSFSISLFLRTHLRTRKLTRSTAHCCYTGIQLQLSMVHEKMMEHKLGASSTAAKHHHHLAHVHHHTEHLCAQVTRFNARVLLSPSLHTTTENGIDITVGLMV